MDETKHSEPGDCFPETTIQILVCAEIGRIPRAGRASRRLAAMLLLRVDACLLGRSGLAMVLERHDGW